MYTEIKTLQQDIQASLDSINGLLDKFSEQNERFKLLVKKLAEHS